MPIQLPDARHLSDEALQVLRLRALRGIELGYSELDLADLLGVCHETISRWWTAYSAEGLTSLPGGRSGRPRGTGRLLSDAQAQRMPAETAPASIDAHRDVLWNAAAGLDPVQARLEIEAAIGAALRRNTRLRGHHITVTAGVEGLVTLTGTVPTQALRQEVELSCWTVPGVWTLHDDLAVGRSAIRA